VLSALGARSGLGKTRDEASWPAPGSGRVQPGAAARRASPLR
jgi:hypothetical protein